MGCSIVGREIWMLYVIEEVGLKTDWIWGPLEERDVLETGRSQVYLISLLRTEVTQA